MHLTVNAFRRSKAGNEWNDWEDRVSVVPAGERGDGTAVPATRLAVADGATDAYESYRWAQQLVSSFAPLDVADDASPERLTADKDVVVRWLEQMQERWAESMPEVFTSPFDEEQYHRRGSFATLLGVEIEHASTSDLRWRAFALGDTVLFHVSQGHLVRVFPQLRAEDFDTTPDGAHTAPSSLPAMAEGTLTDGGSLQPDDVLLIATDALAAWLIGAREARRERGWLRELCAMISDVEFERFVDAQRASGAMHNDDVTLLRVRLADPEYLVGAL